MYPSGMSARRFGKGLVAAGFVVGSVFGVIDLFLTWLDPVQDGHPGRYLSFTARCSRRGPLPDSLLRGAQAQFRPAWWVA
jgi:hypothetical protein